MRIEQIIRISMKQRKEDIMKKISKKQWLALGVLSALSFCGVVGVQAETTGTINKDVILTGDRIVEITNPADYGIDAGKESRNVTVNMNKKALTFQTKDMNIGEFGFHMIEGSNHGVTITNPGDTPIQIVAKAVDDKIIPFQPSVKNGEVVGIRADYEKVKIDGDVNMKLHGVGFVRAIKVENNAGVTISGKLTIEKGKLTSVCGERWDEFLSGKRTKRQVEFQLEPSNQFRIGMDIGSKDTVTIGEVNIYAPDKGIVAKKGSSVTIGSGVLKTESTKGGIGERQLFDLSLSLIHI